MHTVRSHFDSTHIALPHLDCPASRLASFETRHRDIPASRPAIGRVGFLTDVVEFTAKAPDRLEFIRLKYRRNLMNIAVPL